MPVDFVLSSQHDNGWALFIRSLLLMMMMMSLRDSLKLVIIRDQAILLMHILTLQAEHSIDCLHIQLLLEISSSSTSVNVVEQIEKEKDSLSEMMNVVGNDWCKVTNPWSLSSCHHLKPYRVDVWSFFFNYSFVLMGPHEHTHLHFSSSSIKDSLSIFNATATTIDDQIQEE